MYRNKFGQYLYLYSFFVPLIQVWLLNFTNFARRKLHISRCLNEVLATR